MELRFSQRIGEALSEIEKQYGLHKAFINYIKAKYAK
jgi:hypothetical protein